MDNEGRTANYNAHLEPGKYYIANHGGKETMLEIKVDDPSEEYILDIDCNNGKMQLHQINTKTQKK